MSSHANAPPLTGRIYFSCPSYHHVRKKKTRRKRKRDEVSDVTAPQMQEREHEEEPTMFSGYVFQTETNRYLLSTPQRWSKLVCDACRFGFDVTVLKFVIWKLDQRNNEELLEVLEMMMSGCEPEYVPQRRIHKSDVWSLSQLARREAMDQIEGMSIGSMTNVLLECYTLVATVVAVSPILSMDPTDPFALIELEDEDDDYVEYGKSCVVVLKKEGLSCLEAIVPGEVLILHNVAKQKWRIMEVFLQLQGTVPSSVFVVDKADQIHWGTTSVLRNCNPRHHHTIEGRVKAVHFMMDGDNDDSKRIHFLEIEDGISLFVTYSPMSTSLQLSLRVGAFVRAANLSMLGNGAYGACIRSYLAITTMATRTISQSNTEQELTLSCRDAVPFDLLRVRRSYQYMFCRSSVSETLHEFRSVPFSNGTYMLPSLDNFTQALIGKQGTNKKAPPRNAYVEFFDQCVQDTHTKVARSLGAGCHIPCHEGDGSTVPLPIGLNRIQEEAFALFGQRLNDYSRQESVGVGWTGSVVLSAQWLSQGLLGSSADAKVSTAHVPSIYTVGYGDLHCADGMVSMILSNGRLELPVVLCKDGDSASEAQIGCGFIWARVCVATVACICIGKFETLHNCESSNSLSMLPPLRNRSTKWVATKGSCGVIAANGYCFVVTLFLVCDCLRPLQELVVTGENDATSEQRILSVKECLSSQISGESTATKGILARTLYKPYREKSGEYKGCSLTVAHSPFGNGESSSNVSCLQSVELTPPIEVHGTARNILRNTLASEFGQKMHEDRLTLGLMWWTLGNCSRTCALLAGGWDNASALSGEAALSMGVHVRLPPNSIVRDSKRGYTRVRCKMRDVVATIRMFPNQGSGGGHAPFDFIGCRAFTPGALDRRPLRKQCNGAAHGELLVNPLHSGVPSRRLGDLLGLLCEDLASRTRSCLLPSLVCAVHNATFLGVSYCRALAECSTCYAPLRVPSGKKQCDWEIEENRPSFWHLPMAGGSAIHGAPVAPPTPQVSFAFSKRKGQFKSALQCPNRCSEDNCAIKWECSGILDDGTGQAKLYAEREAALCLLGLSAAVIETIERGSWLVEGGIIYTKSMPPKEGLRDAALAARKLAMKNHRMQLDWKSRKMEENDVLVLLTPTVRAEYLLQRHCRFSSQPSRELLYFVRTKPLSDGLAHLNQTEINVSGRDIATYALPPLKLNLVDCAVPRMEAKQG